MDKDEEKLAILAAGPAQQPANAETGKSEPESKTEAVTLVFDPAPVKQALASHVAATNAPKRRIWLCADDYGISPGVNDAIRELILRGRINATSVMTVAPSFSRSEAMPLTILKAGSQQIAIGLHVTLTAPFRPLSRGYGPLADGAFLPLKATLRAALLRRLKPQKIAIEVGAQIKAFAAAFGKMPDFVDGHQHVHVFPQVREAVIAAVRHHAPNAWLRHCGGRRTFGKLFYDRKGFLIDRLSGALRARAGKFGLKTNPAFAGTYSFKDSADYPALFPKFLRRLPEGGVVMCHPGHVDDELKRLDTLTNLREKEFAFFAGDAFPGILERHGVRLG